MPQYLNFLNISVFVEKEMYSIVPIALAPNNGGTKCVKRQFSLTYRIL